MKSKDNRITVVENHAIEQLIPPPTRSPIEWAEAKRQFPPEHAEPGPYRAARMPWLKFFGQRVMSPLHDVIVFVCGSQMTKTDGLLMNIIGWKLDEDPQPIVYFGPTEKNVLAISRDRLDPMIKNVPSLFQGLKKGQADTLTTKYVNGSRIGLGWAGSATELASHSAWCAILDEYDRMSALKREGDAYELAAARVSSYPDGKIIVTSTPLEGDVEEEEDKSTKLKRWKVSEKIGSPTWRLWQQGTRHEWAWPCINCGEYFIPRMSLLWWPEDATPEQARKEARLQCPNCGSLIESESKSEMNSRGVFVAPGQNVSNTGELIGDEEPNPICSGWISGICSSFRSNDFGRLAYRMCVALNSRDEEKIRGVVNTGFGEPYAPTLRDFGWEKVAARGADYRFGEVPDGVVFLVMGSDVAESRIDWVIRGFGADFESWLIDRGELHGQTNQPEIWRDCAKIQARVYKKMHICAHGIDTGYRADDVFTFVKGDMHTRYATKGEDVLAGGYKIGFLKERQAYQVRISTDMAKSWVHSRLDLSPLEPGQWHVPETIDRDYCRQIVAERRSVSTRGKPSWKPFGANHKLDCEAICYIMARLVAPQHHLSLQNDAPVKRRKRRRMISTGVEL